MSTETKVDENSWAYDLGKTCYETIADMVACLQADRDVLLAYAQCFHFGTE